MSEGNVQLVRRWWAGFNESGLPPFELCDERIEVIVPKEWPFTGHYHGHSGVRQWAEEVFDAIEGHRVDIEEIIEIDDGETVVMLMRSHGHWKHMDLDFEMPWAAVWRIRAGKLVHGHGYMTKEEAFEAAGMSG
jgi:ketosteroid isomerase-like protein